jgi:ribose transport system ATP-binding protein
MAPILELRDITKTFPGVRALDGVHFDVRVGEVHALLGENGAGKSTLIKIVSGVYQPDEGELLVNGEPVRFASPLDASRRNKTVGGGKTLRLCDAMRIFPRPV